MNLTIDGNTCDINEITIKEIMVQALQKEDQFFDI